MLARLVRRGSRAIGRPEKHYREWLFFRALLDNSQMSLSRVGVSTAREYTWLCQNADTKTGICE